MSGRSCSLARTVFFKCDLLLGEKAPDRAIANMDITRGKRPPYVMKRQIGRRSDKSEQPVPLILETPMALPAHRLSRDAPALPKPLRPPNNAAHRDAELSCRFAAACSRPDSRHDAGAKIFRIGLRHPCWPPPSQHLESQRSFPSQTYRRLNLNLHRRQLSLEGT